MQHAEPTETSLIQAAREARVRAYVPYSRFAMGAAVRLEDGAVYQGAVVENVSLGLAMCAERAALFASVCGGPARPTTLVLAAPRTDGRLTYPCGACLQVALELGGPSLRIVVVDADADAGTDDAAATSTTVEALLPRGPRKS